MKIIDCKTNHLTNPLGFHLGQTVFSYKVADSRGKFQTDARIMVALDEKFSRVVYDSGYSTELDSLGHAAKINMVPRTRYFWTVTVRTDADEQETSAVNWFETAKMDEPWTASWITCDAQEPRHPIFKRDIPVGKELDQARLYICGLGLYEATINDERVGDEHLTPYCNDYNSWLQAQTFDVTDQLAKGGRLEVMLGNGWYLGRFGFTSRPDQAGYYAKTPKLIAEIHLDYADGTSEVIGTDERWQVGRSTICFSNIYDGEKDDTTLPAMADVPASLCSEAMAPLTDRLSPPVRIREVLPAVELLTTPAGEKVYDIGQNLAGIFRLKVDVPSGSKVHLQFGEVLQGGNFYRDNLRSAKAEYIWISDGRPTVLEPHFTFYGYRYVKVSGVDNLKPEDFTALALYSEIPPIGTLTTGSDQINQLIANIKWGQKGNFLDVPTDCPQRDERMGWTGDAQVFSATANYLTDCYAFYRKYLWDMQLEQAGHGGCVPDVVPAVGVDSCSSVWGDATCIIPWNMYLFTGDKTIIEEHFDAMQSWVDYITRIDGDDHAWRRHDHYGDWLALDHPDNRDDQTQGATDKGFIADVYYRESARIVAQAARLLGKSETAIQYDALADRILADLKAEFFSPTERCCVDTQTAHLLSLRYDLVNHREKAVKALQKTLQDVGNKLKTGFVGTPLLCNVLSDHGLDDLAYGLLLNEEYPGWLYSINLGATTIWERWNSVMPDGSISSTGMNSLNHYAYGSIGEWLFRRVAGIRPVESAPGFRQAVIAPMPDRRLGHIEAVYHSAAGTYQSSWRVLDDDSLEISLRVPFGCTAEVQLPYAPDSLFENSNNPLFADCANGICSVGPGDYRVRYEPTKPLRVILSTHSPIRLLMQHPGARKLLEGLGPSIPQQMWDMSLRELQAKYSQQDDEQQGRLDQMDQVLKALDN